MVKMHYLHFERGLEWETYMSRYFYVRTRPYVSWDTSCDTSKNYKILKEILKVVNKYFTCGLIICEKATHGTFD